MYLDSSNLQNLIKEDKACMLYSMFRNLKLAPKIITLLIIVIFGLMSIYGIFQISRMEKSLNSDAEKNHILLLSNSLGVFSKSIWEFDKDISTRGMSPLFDGGTVQSIRIFDVRGNLFNGLRFSKSVDGKNQIDAIVDDHFKYSDLKIGEPSKAKMIYNDKPSLMVASIENYPEQRHRLVASLWWKENSDASPNFLGNVVMEFSTKYIKELIHEQKIIFVGLSVMLSVSILFLTFIFLEFQVIFPIAKLMQVSLEVASGKFTILKPRNAKDEIGSLTDNFNYMVNKIERNLTLIRGLSEASQEIVKCKYPVEVGEVYGMYAKKLLKATRIEIWINSLSEASTDAINMKRLSDNKDSDKSDLSLQKMISTKDVIRLEEINSEDFIHVMVVPLLNSNHILLGMVEIFYNKNEVKYGEEEVRIIKGLAVSLSTAIENYWHVLKEKDRANLERDNQCIHQTGRQTYFMTMVAALFNFKEGKMYASSAGHTPPAFVFPKEGKSEIKYIYPANGSRLGFDAEYQYQSQTFDFKPGQQILFYTDGIIEGESPAGKEYGLKKLKQSMEIHGAEAPDNFVQKIADDAFKFFDGTPAKDDIAMLVIRNTVS